MPFGFGGGGSKGEDKEDYSSFSIKKPLTYDGGKDDDDDLEEISKITEMLNQDERVLLVAKQSRIKPGGSHFIPNIIYATDTEESLLDIHICLE
jgi:hypothetical protein